MHHFVYIDKELYCEDVPVREIAKAVGTPFYLYSKATLIRHFQEFDCGFEKIPHITCFAVKACSNIAILNLFASLGGGADIVSGGELFRALRASVDPGKIIYSGVGKTTNEIRAALEANILLFNVESTQELTRLNAIAGEVGKKAPVALRVNPDVDPKTHAYISTGLKSNKFGIPVEDALEEYIRATGLGNVKLCGISCHIGSQLTEISPFIEALRKLKIFLGRLAEEGIEVSFLDLGGGVGIIYDNETPPHPREYAQAVLDELEGLNCTLILEPGRVISGNAGVLISEVQYTKVNRAGEKDKRFVIIDAAMNDLARPSLYNAYHEILPVKQRENQKQLVDIVGPICESGDFMARSRLLPEVSQGDLLAIMSCGAYGFSMASNYNSRPRAPEVLVSGQSFEVIRRREQYEDLVRGEILQSK